MFPVSQSKRMWLLLPLAAAAVLAVGMVVGEHARVSSDESLKSLGRLFGMSALLGTLSCMGIVPGLLLLLAPGELRRAGVCLILVSLAGFIGFQAGWRVSHPIRMRAFHALAERSRPLVAAIREYESNHGHPPLSLEKLVPDYLPAVPQTRMNHYPQFKYLHGEEAQSFASNRWILRLDCPVGAFAWDVFLYFPNTNYPATGYGGALERVGDWAYVHE